MLGYVTNCALISAHFTDFRKTVAGKHPDLHWKLNPGPEPRVRREQEVCALVHTAMHSQK